MSVRYLNKLVKTVCHHTVLALGHQVSAYRILFIAFTIVFLGSLVIVPPELAMVGYALPLGFVVTLAQINTLMADKLSEYGASISNQLSEAIDHLKQQLCFWRELVLSFLAVNPRPEISFFARLSHLIGLTQLPLLSAPLAFRS